MLIPMSLRALTAPISMRACGVTSVAGGPPGYVIGAHL
jgi:hypothetical protein